jgi:serine/threonine protein phosphatase PrpC
MFYKEDFIYKKLAENKYKFIKIAFEKANQDLRYSNIDVNFSGTTCNLVFIIEDKVICANVGDSRSFLMTENLDIVNLSFDHKPDLPLEKGRIEKMGGIIEKSYGKFNSINFLEDGPSRVWVKNQQYPGIAMSRSLGDLVAKNVGIISKPGKINLYFISDITEHSLKELIINGKKCNGELILIASDGVWEFFDEQEVINIIKPFYDLGDIKTALNVLIKAATKKWKEDDSVVDDITVVIITLRKQFNG